MFKILQSSVKLKKVILFDMGYPYGKKVYMSGSVVVLAAQLMAVGHTVDIVDLNIDNLADVRVKELLFSAEVIGLSVMGSPSVPRAIKVASELQRAYPKVHVIVGGQVISRFTEEQFESIFGEAFMQATPENITGLFGELPSAYEISYQPVWDSMGNGRLREYLLHEFALVFSQGCIYNCSFCSAQKGQREIFRDLSVFRGDLRYLLGKAQELGLPQLECYASSLDFFQTSKTILQFMEVMAVVQEEFGVRLLTRCLTCMGTFLAASRQREDFLDLLKRSGLWCLGFGVDGPTEETWREQNKTQNHMSDIDVCFDLCQQAGVRAEVLTVLGYPGDSAKRIWQTVGYLSMFIRRWPNTVLRPYVAREILPGNDGWKNSFRAVGAIVRDPVQFYNLDICGLANFTTHPRRWQRWLVNAVYLWVILRYGPFGRCATSPLLPQGSNGLCGKLGKFINRYMPFDR